MKIIHLTLILEIAIYDLAAKPEWADNEFEHNAQLAKLPGEGVKPVEFEFAIKPYLQFVTQNSITVMWETTKSSNTDMNELGICAAVKSLAKMKDRFI